MGGFIGFIIIGALAGFIAGKLMKGEGFGFWVNLVVGIVGGIFGGFVLRLFGVSSNGGLIWSLLTSVGGAALLLWILSLLKKKK
ncbi:MAG: GlsB/YeaQ/YmgE family stress response membrane protein [Bacteroidales bacterium]|jgi:uncharacterized membrane protein YeaQ/YmgE (transglycosylase-associated protein family)|nr:GlsB/YeaQ/YmgE family stress response membrane protein [Bacteroidales bacterium]MDD2204921.1 GlsB/YeaQ/YmgE family stress response membrane protein [Bacteroidales bacterium]MDD3152686.1 GlsB/YeaQ/YmgE family stress response membrane protein [Bacteroidales bacterium]MDD3914544.1 GlsB/YeaQ/YmgE family stress response membrane protein [Bacteroidales bacterium]MDD4634438.1 GlsB/YeaQ/YmgE family stress response membrane protein [Bacteroidales bacterium]